MSGKELYVICNGFDKHHVMACEYADFRLWHDAAMKQLKVGDIDETTAKINTRPRKKFNVSTPFEELINHLL